MIVFNDVYHNNVRKYNQWSKTDILDNLIQQGATEEEIRSVKELKVDRLRKIALRRVTHIGGVAFHGWTSDFEVNFEKIFKRPPTYEFPRIEESDHQLETESLSESKFEVWLLRYCSFSNCDTEDYV